MEDRYRLIFRGEVLEGQHPAVVRRRLGQELAFSDTQLDALFSGRPLVVKRDLDKPTAARYQALFRKAGARLRAVSEVSADALPAASAQDAPASDAPAPDAPAQAAPGAGPVEFELLPAGSDLLRADERVVAEAPELDLDAFELSEPGVFSVTPAPAAEAPDVSHLSLAAPGERLTESSPDAATREFSAPAFEVAEVGAELAPRRAAPVPVVDLATVNFEVAETGAILAPPSRKPVPEAPDTGHLDIVDDR